MDCVWKARKFQAPPCLEDRRCLSRFFFGLPLLFSKARQPAAASAAAARANRALNATFEDERWRDAMQTPAFT